MTFPKVLYVSILFLVSHSLFSFQIEKAQTVHLTCEYHKNPIGIGVAKPRLSWQIQTSERNWKQSAYEIRTANSVAGLEKNSSLKWSTGKIRSDESVNIPYAGPALVSFERVYWQVRVWSHNGAASSWSTPAFWEMGILNTKLWTASFIGMKDFTKEKKSHPSQYFRKEFQTKNNIESARVYVTSLGLYELQLNGKKLSEDLFTPGYTSYKHRLQYQTYDITHLLEKDNAIGAIVGDGWYRGNIGWKGDFAYYGDQLALFVQLHIHYKDGSSEVIESDQNWKASYGPILKSDMYNGEKYDARLEMNGWSSVNFNADEWKTVELVDYAKNKLTAPQGPPVKAIEEIIPEKLITTPKGEIVLDLGQNIVGWARMKVQGDAGHKVTLKFAEVLDKEGNFYTTNLRAAEATDSYILKGNGEEVFEPHFTSHGFRYIQVINYPGELNLSKIKGVVIHSDMPETGSFTTSNPMINQLQSNIRWGQKDNFLDIPTDCPQRDERAGWTGDAQVFSNTASFNFDVAAFYTKWLKDLKVDQYESGAVPNVIPDILTNAKGMISKGGATGWADAAVIIPWNVYLNYGDKRILEEQYESMKKWVEFMRRESGEDFLWNNPKHWHWGDWLAYNADKPDYNGSVTEKDLIATAYAYHSTILLSKAAEVLGKSEDQNRFTQHAAKVKKAFADEYITPNGRLVSHTQTAYALALTFDLIPEELIEKSAAYFAGDIEKFGHLTTGFLGTPLLCTTLTQIGREDLAFKLLNRKKFPSWLYPITMGATTIWERWDTQKPDGTIIEGMNSFNHYAYGAIGEWMYEYIGGIKKSKSIPGYREIIFNPHLGGGLTYSKTSFDSMYGLIKAHHKKEQDIHSLNIEIPPNTTGIVILPTDNVKLSNAPISNSEIIEHKGEKAIKLGSGKYDFTWKI